MIFKFLVCNEHKYKKHDATGKGSGTCPHCGKPLVMTDKWYVRYQHEGKRVVKAISTRKADAQDYLASVRLAVRSGDVLPGEEVVKTWKDGKERMRKEFELGRIRPASWDLYSACLKQLSTVFRDNENLANISASRLSDWVDKRVLAGKANATINREISTVKRMYALLTDDMPARKAPKLHYAMMDMKKVKLLPENNEKEVYLSTDEVHRLIDCAPTAELRLAIILMVATGLRPGNVYQMEYAWIDFDKQSITIPAAAMKGKKTFTIGLGEDLTQAIRQYRLAQKRIGRFLFPSPVDFNKPVNDMRTAWDNACTKAKVSITPHQLRHTFASLLLANGVDIKRVSALMAHANINVTSRRYAHLTEHQKDETLSEYRKAIGMDGVAIGVTTRKDYQS